MNTATGKGTLLTGGITLISAGATLLLTETWYIGLLLMVVGGGFIFAREFVKEQ